MVDGGFGGRIAVVQRTRGYRKWPEEVNPLWQYPDVVCAMMLQRSCHGP